MAATQHLRDTVHSGEPRFSGLSAECAPASRPEAPVAIPDRSSDDLQSQVNLEDLIASLGAVATPWGRTKHRFRTWRKKTLWRAVVEGSLFFKRLIDLVGGFAILLLASPLMLITAIAVKLQDGGPILFWQQRVGRWGKLFWCPKFRSMVLDAEARRGALENQNLHGAGVTFKMRSDPRVTRVGRWIRKLSIDELPQLWSVLIGDMSLVGPRPPIPSEVDRYSLQQRRRLDVKPGLTCIWQVSGRGDVPFAKQVELDVAYIESHSLWLDLKLLARTVPAVLLGRGAY